MNNVRRGRKELRRRREGALYRMPAYLWINSKRCRKGSEDKDTWYATAEAETTTLKEKLATTKEVDYAF